MTMKSEAHGHQTLTAYLIVRRAAEAIAFYTTQFGAKEVRRMEADGKVGHAELRIGASPSGW